MTRGVLAALPASIIILEVGTFNAAKRPQTIVEPTINANPPLSARFIMVDANYINLENMLWVRPDNQCSIFVNNLGNIYLTKHPNGAIVAGRDRPALGEYRKNPLEEGVASTGECLNILVEQDDICNLELALIGRVLTPFDPKVKSGKPGVFTRAERGRVRKVISTALKINEAFDKSCTVLLERFERRHVLKRVAEV